MQQIPPLLCHQYVRERLSIHIPSPCQQRWSEMTPVGKGRFCDSCQKTIVDFTTMSDAQLINYFKQVKGEVCGRFDDDQLNKEIVQPVKRIPWVTYFLNVTIPALLFTSNVKAQSIEKPEMQIAEKVHKSIDSTALPITDNTAYRTITGKVTDDFGMPIPFASVVLKNTTEGVGANEYGQFSIRVKKELQVLSVSAIGYETTEVPVGTKDSVSIQLSAAYRLSGTVGVVVYRKATKRITKKIAKVHTSPVENRIVVFPNPVGRSSILTIGWSHAIRHSQNVEVYNMNGALVQRKMIEVKKSVKEVQIKLNLTTTGNYVVRITDLKSGKMFTEQIIVQ